VSFWPRLWRFDRFRRSRSQSVIQLAFRKCELEHETAPKRQPASFPCKSTVKHCETVGAVMTYTDSPATYTDDPLTYTDEPSLDMTCADEPIGLQRTLTVRGETVIGRNVH
jgi:hypothetical protein